jgi:predicted Holliday junction resolvase-like endonuclease
MTDFVTAGLVLGGVLLGLVLGLFVGRILTARWLERQFVEREGAARADGHRRSRATFGGQALEELAPLFPDFPFNPKDLRFIGDPIDYVVFDGLTEGSLREIVLLEVKSGRSTLSASQRSIRDALRDHAVSWSLYRVPAELTELP